MSDPMSLSNAKTVIYGSVPGSPPTWEISVAAEIFL